MVTREGKKAITSTKNYRLFVMSGENRALDLGKRRKLKESMQQYGFLRCFPLVCVRDEAGHLILKDGQHRLAIAEELNLTVHYIVEDVDFDVAVVNSTAKTWTVRDYAEKFAANGVKAYIEGIAFAEKHHIPITTAFTLLSGTTTFHNVRESFHDGTFKIRDRDWADIVAATYSAITGMSRNCRNNRFMDACMAAGRVEGFDANRLIHGAERCRDKLASYSTRDAYLQMMEDIYNFNRQKLFGLKLKAIEIMRKRNPTSKTAEPKP